MKDGWISTFVLLCYIAIALLAVHRGTQLARDLKECREDHLAYTKHVNAGLCRISHQLGIENSAACEQGD